MKFCNKAATYLPVKFFDDHDDGYGVYTISAKSFPSHIRTILPASDREVAEYLALERARRRLRNVIIVLVVFGISVTLLSLALIFGFQQHNEDTTINRLDHIKQAISWQHTDPQIEVKQDSAVNETDGGQFPSRFTSHRGHKLHQSSRSRTKCVKVCWAYAAFRFQATCIDGFCKCSGSHYDPNTCLPFIGSCNIQRDIVGVGGAAALRGSQQKIYWCREKEAGDSEVHVLSIFGNHRASSTRVVIFGNTSQPAVLVLVSYHAVVWKIKMQMDVEVKHIVLVSYNHLAMTRVIFDGLKIKDYPVISRLMSLTGYGEDRFGGHTPELLMKIEDNIGHIKTFTGTSHADSWELDLNDKAVSNDIKT